MCSCHDPRVFGHTWPCEQARTDPLAETHAPAPTIGEMRAERAHNLMKLDQRLAGRYRRWQTRR